jgi:Rps23 Pro-64 3,4-dihydroxylase Tpa1-like proline 4-hydroxylase
MIDLTQIARRTLESDPYAWGQIDGLYREKDAVELAATYPRDHFKTVSGHDGEKKYLYESRALLKLGEEKVSYPEELSSVWRQLAEDLLSPEYRTTMSLLTGYDLTAAPIEANVYHYAPGASLGSHLDLPYKLVTHVLYFNRSWNESDGGCLAILRSGDERDLVRVILPLVGNSAVLVRSDRSWHAVQRVAQGSTKSRRAVTVTFYRPGSVSPMWPAGDTTELHRYEGPYEEAPRARSWFGRRR